MARFLKVLSVTLWCLGWQLVVGSVCQAGWVKDYVTPATNTWVTAASAMNAAGEAFVARVIHVGNGKAWGGVVPGEMAKIDQKGKVLWSKRYYIGDHAGDLPLVINLIRSTDDGGCVVSGHTRENLTSPWAMPYWFAMKLDAEGAVVWLTKLGHPALPSQWSFPYVQINDIAPAMDGGFALTGTLVPNLASSMAFVIKLGSNGELEWQRRIQKYVAGGGWSAGSVEAYNIVPGGDGEFFVVGSTERGGNSLGRLMIFKVDQNGNLLWQKKVLDDSSSAISPTSVGESRALASPGDGGLTMAVGGANGEMLIKFDGDGNGLWGKIIVPQMGSSSIYHSENGGYYYLNVRYLMRIMELDENGEPLWARDFSRLLGQYPRLAPVNGGFNIGTHNTSNLGSGFYNFVMAQIDSAGQLTDCDPSVMVTPAPARDFNLTVVDMVGLESDEVFFQVSGQTVVSRVAVLSVVDDKCNSVNVAPLADAGDPQEVRCTGPSGALVQLDGSLSSDPDGDQLSFSWSGPFGEVTGVNPLVQLPFGDHRISLAVTDSFGNSSQATVLISVVDDIAPRTVVSISGVAGSNGWYTSGLNLSFYSTDNCAGCAEIQYALDGIVTLVPGNKAELQISEEGYHFLSYRAVDRAGNQEEISSLALAIDQTPPGLLLPADMMMEAVDANGTPGAFSIGVADNLDPNPLTYCEPVSGTIFAVGTSRVACTSTDLAGNRASGSFQVTVADTTAPVVVPPPDQEVQYRGRATVIDIGQATAVDAVGVVSLVNDSPGIFPLGITLVTWTATDLYGNIGTAGQTINVVRGNSEEVRNDDHKDAGRE